MKARLKYGQLDGTVIEELTDWSSFRREAAKDILASMVCHSGGDADIERAIELADALIEKLKQE